MVRAFSLDAGLLDPAEGARLDQLAEAARQLAMQAVEKALTTGGYPTEILEAQEAVADGDVLRAEKAFKDAVNKYKDALSKVE